MTERTKVSGVQNEFFDSQEIDNDDLSLEQNYNNNVHTSFINNHVGSGVLPEVLVKNIIFDSNDSSFNGVLFDGKAINVLFQPSDSNLGNQLELELIGSNVAGQKNVKVAIIGLDFQGNLQYDTFVFKINEKQITKKHYTNVLTILFNDFRGASTQSFNLGGRFIIAEANPFSLSRDIIMVAQDIEPNLFFRDFFVEGISTLNLLLTTALPLFNIDSLGIMVGYKENKIIVKNDVVTHVGEKFLATTNNIQKISLLLAVQNTDVGQASNLNWQGDLIVSIYPLQSSVSCPNDIVPNLAIDFSPNNIPLAQISLNYTTLQASGITLDGTPQPVDFVFSNTPVAAGSAIVAGNYYALTIKRSGSANQCDILIAAGSSHVQESRVTIFTGTTWVDIPEENLWFQIYTDAAKVSDGQAYETGRGIEIPKIKLDSIHNSQIDYCLDKIQFVGNQLFTGVASAVLEKSAIVQDQRTGNPVFSQKQFVPDIKLLNPIDLSNLKLASDPLLIGLISDKNLKSFDSTNSTLTASLQAWTFVNNQLLIKIITDQTDPRYDLDVESLESNIVNGDFIDAKIVPDASDPSVFYRSSKAEVISMIYGDVNGDGIVDDKEIGFYNRLLGADLRTAPPTLTSITDGYSFVDGYTTTIVNGYKTYINLFVNESSLSYKIINSSNNTFIHTGSDGYLVVNPNDGSLANFNSVSFDFTTISSLTDYKLAILTGSNSGNIGLFTITGIDGYVAGNPAHTINISKLHYTSDTLMEIMRADIDGDFLLSTADGYHLHQYISRAGIFPPVVLPASKIGTVFKVIRLTVDPFIYNNLNVITPIPNRTDNFYSGSNRSVELHPLQDIFIGDGYTNFPSHDFSTTPLTFNIIKQLSWKEYLVFANGNARIVPASFSLNEGKVQNSCSIEGIKYKIFPNSPEFDSGIVDTFIPNNLVIGDGGELKRSDGDFYKVDFEVGTIVLEIPDGLFAIERAINVFDDFIADYNDLGITRLGFPAMRFADCSLVDTNALENNQVRFSVSVQSFSPNTNGIDQDGYSGAIVDGKIGVAMDYATGILTLNFTNLYQDSVLATLNTKIQINVFLKKGGFNNTPIFVDSFKIQNILNLISVFSGAGTEGGPISVVDLETETIGILPVENGGTGLDAIGSVGTVLASDGYGLVYQAQNPIFIPIFHGLGSTQSSTPTTLSAFTFRFDQIADGYTSIKLEVILETTNISNAAQIKLFNITTNSYVVLNTGSSTILSTTNQTPTLIRSINLSSILGQSSLDYIYELRLILNPTSGGDFAYCKMARLAVLYS